MNKIMCFSILSLSYIFYVSRDTPIYLNELEKIKFEDENYCENLYKLNTSFYFSPYDFFHKQKIILDCKKKFNK